MTQATVLGAETAATKQGRCFLERKPQGEPVNQRAQAGGNERQGAPWGLWDKGLDCSLELELDCLEEQELSREGEGLLHTWASSGKDPKMGKAVEDLREDDCG